MSEARNPVHAAPVAETQEVVVELDRSVRWPGLLLLWAGAKWLVLATLLGLLGSLKFHAPGLLADAPWLTYGRLQPAFWNILIYGFALQSAWGVGLWLVVRMGRTPLTYPVAAVAGAVVWNLGVLIGVAGVLAGDSTGYPGLELPGYATPLLLLGCGLISLSLLMTFRARQVVQLEPTQWFLLAAIFWFPWVYSSAQLLLVASPLRGIMQAIVAWWYGAQLSWLCLGFLGLAILWTLIPLLLQRPLYSRYHALLAFWMLVVFTGWRGIPTGAPVPAWLPGVSTVFAMLSLVPVLAVALNVHHTLAGRYREVLHNKALLLASLGALAYLLAMVLGILQQLPAVGRITELTFFGPGVQGLWIYGFMGCTLLAMSYVLVPRLLPTAFPSKGLMTIQAWTFVAGTLLHALPLILGGVAQGQSLAQAPERVFMEAFQPGLMALRLSTLGDLVLLVSAVLYGVNFGRGLLLSLRGSCSPWVAEVLRPEPVEAAR